MREYWIKIWEVLLGWEPGNDILTPLPAALFVFFSVLVNGLMLYHVTKAIVPEPVKEYALDFIKTMTLCSYFVGHVLMWKGFGVPALALGILLALLITSIALKDGAGSPVNVWVAYFENLIPLRKCLLKTAIQTWAGFSAYHFAMFLISVEFNPVYTELLQPYNAGRCDSHLKVPILKGALIEFAGTFYMVWIMYQKLMKNKGLDQLLKLVNIVFIVLLGIQSTGMHMHPAKASGLTWGCGSTPKSVHILVYWICPFIATWLAVKTSKVITLNRDTPTKDKSEQNGSRTSDTEVKYSKNADSKKQARKRKT